MQMVLDIDDDVVQRAQVVAEEKSITLDSVISSLAREGLARRGTTQLITLEDIKRYQEEIDDADARRALMLD